MILLRFEFECPSNISVNIKINKLLRGHLKIMIIGIRVTHIKIRWEKGRPVERILFKKNYCDFGVSLSS
jgi:hypothetical protein